MGKKKKNCSLREKKLFYSSFLSLAKKSFPLEEIWIEKPRWRVQQLTFEFCNKIEFFQFRVFLNIFSRIASLHLNAPNIVDKRSEDIIYLSKNYKDCRNV